MTIESRDTLQENQLLTHEGACGLCSSLQDLSVFMTSPDLTSLEADCGSRIRVSFEDGVACYMDAGFSEACASIRGYKTLQSSSLCVDFCRTETAVSNTGRPPSCELDDCLLCDELVAGLTYKRFAGRTRRNSGLLSGHVHNCVEIAGITHQNPCAAIGEAHSPPKCQGRLSVCSQDSDCCSGRCEDRRCRISKLRLSLNYRGGANMSGNVDDLP